MESIAFDRPTAAEIRLAFESTYRPGTDGRYRDKLGREAFDRSVILYLEAMAVLEDGDSDG